MKSENKFKNQHLSFPTTYFPKSIKMRPKLLNFYKRAEVVS